MYKHSNMLLFLLLLFVWNPLTVSQKVSITIPLRRDPLRVDVAGLQGMQWVCTLQQCALWSGGSLRRGKQVMRSRPIGREIRHIWLGHISDDLEWRSDVSVVWTQVVDTFGLSRHHVRVPPLQSTTAPMSPAPFGLDSRVVKSRLRKVGDIWDATWVAHVGSPRWEHDPWAPEPSCTPAGWHGHGESAVARCCWAQAASWCWLVLQRLRRYASRC